MRSVLLVILPLLATPACARTPDRDPAPATREVTATAVATPAASSASSVSGSARAVARSDDLASFELSIPAAAGAIAPLARLIEDKAALAEAQMRTEARAEREAAGTNGYTYRPHFLSFEWTVLANTSRFLSLRNDLATYSGGAHGMVGVQSLVWDKEAGMALDGADLFTSPAALNDAIRKRYCAALDAARRERRGIEARIGGAFDACPAVGELTVLIGSDNGQTFDRLTLYAGPYVAGPYAEGPYTIDLPVDPAALASVKPRYRSAFTAR